MFRSIRWRLIFSFILVALLAVGAVGLLVLEIVAHQVKEQQIAYMHSSAQAIAQEASALMHQAANTADLEQLANIASLAINARVRVLDSVKKNLVDSGIPHRAGRVWLTIVPGGTAIVFGDGAEEPAPLFFSIQNSLKDLPTGTVFLGPEFIEPLSLVDIEEINDDLEMMMRTDTVVSVPVIHQGPPMGYIELSQPLNAGAAVLDTLRQALFFAGIGAVALAALLGLLISQRLASPLRSLADTASRMGAGDLSARAALKPGGEIGELSRQFNRMAEQLQANFQQLESERDALRRFIADASHELRTPVAALKNFNTLLSDSDTDDMQAEFISESQAQIERLEWVTRNLLDLSRLDAGLLALDLADHDLREIVEDALAPFKPLAGEKGVSLNIDLSDEPVILQCDHSRMQMALHNLLDNAIKFTPSGGEVEVAVGGDAQATILSVRDSGIGIPPDDLPHIFERFYRGQQSTEQGSGLGLAIVKSIIEAHNGQVSVESTPSAGTIVTLKWAGQVT